VVRQQAGQRAVCGRLNDDGIPINHCKIIIKMILR
jgi:hypothetical protein